MIIATETLRSAFIFYPKIQYKIALILISNIRKFYNIYKQTGFMVRPEPEFKISSFKICFKIL